MEAIEFQTHLLSSVGSCQILGRWRKLAKKSTYAPQPSSQELKSGPPDLLLFFVDIGLIPKQFVEPSKRG